MWRGMFQIVAATAVFAAVHSVLAGAWAKGVAADWCGERLVRAWYRPFFLAQSLALAGLLLWYVLRQPARELYRVRGPAAWALRAGQGLALALAVWAVAHAGVGFLVGWDGAAAWLDGAEVVPPGPDGQGPAPAGEAMQATGPFAYTRHPLNWFALPLLWLNPRMTTRLLAFNIAATAYMFAGSVHLESHLVAAYGEAYRAYQGQVPFFLFGR